MVIERLREEELVLGIPRQDGGVTLASRPIVRRPLYTARPLLLEVLAMLNSVLALKRP